MKVRELNLMIKKDFVFCERSAESFGSHLGEIGFHIKPSKVASGSMGHTACARESFCTCY